MSLTDTAVRQAKRTGKAYTLNDTDGLALFVTAKGAKSWHFRFYWAHKQCRISFGSYPAISLKRARELRNEARTLLAEGIDPRAERRQARESAARTFQVVFETWRDFKALSLEEGRQSTLSQINRIFRKDVLPWIGQKPASEVTRQDLLQILRRIEHRKAFSTAEKCRTWFNQLFRYSIVTLDLQSNPAADLDIVAAPQPPVRHNPFLRMHQMPEFLRTLRWYPGDIYTTLGLRLLLLTGVRTGELRYATPEQFDLKQALWTIPPDVVKQLQRRLKREDRKIPPYLVPLPRQAVEIIEYLFIIMMQDWADRIDQWETEGPQGIAAIDKPTPITNTLLALNGLRCPLTGI